MMCWCLGKKELSGCGSIVLELLHTLTMFSKMLEMGKKPSNQSSFSHMSTVNYYI